MVRPAPSAAASALARASATARRSASRSSFARSFTSNRMPLTEVAPDATAISSSSPTRSTASTRTSMVLRATYPRETRRLLTKSHSCCRSYATVRIGSAGIPAARSLSMTGAIASAFRRCASRGLDARDSAVIVNHARSGTEWTTASPVMTTTAAGRDILRRCERRSDKQQDQHRKAAIHQRLLSSAASSNSDACRAVQVGQPCHNVRVEISVVRRRVQSAIAAARERARRRRSETAEAETAYESFLQDVAIPVTKQVASGAQGRGPGLHRVHSGKRIETRVRPRT